MQAELDGISGKAREINAVEDKVISITNSVLQIVLMG
jgi:hypothetical protein